MRADNTYACDQEDHLSRIEQVIAALEAERADLQELGLAGPSDRRVSRPSRRPAGDGPEALDATSNRAPRQHAPGSGRRRQSDVQARIISFLTDHPNSTAGDVAKALNANRNTTATRLSQMVKTGEIKKASKGYATK
jgi:hypothetical protein